MSKEKPDAWMPLYTGDWDGDTAMLSCEEDGAYGRLVRSYWRHGPPRDDDVALARIVRMDLKAWRRVRPAVAAYFRIIEGVWRHKRVDEELIKWTAKRAKAIAKAQDAAEKRWGKKDAPSIPPGNAPGNQQALHEQCPSASSTEVEANKEASTLCGRQDADAHADGAPPPDAWPGPDSVWAAFSEALGEAWCEKFLRPCRWQDVPDRALIPPHPTIGVKMLKDCRSVLAKLGLQLLEKAA